MMLIEAQNVNCMRQIVNCTQAVRSTKRFPSLDEYHCS